MTEEKKKKPLRFWHAVTTYVPPVPRVILLLLPVVLLLHVLSRLFVPVADGINQTIAAGVRFVLAKISDLLPFSIAETLLIALPALVILLVVGAVYAARTKRGFWRYLTSLLSVLAALYILFVLTIGCGYNATTLDQQLGLQREKVSKEDLYETAVILMEETNRLADEFARVNGASVMPYSMAELNEKLLSSYDTVCEQYDFIQSMDSRLKAVSLSDAMSYTHITGVYSYMTGEANLNVAFPDYTLPFTAAHELAHQRGIARENEANFVAFLVCIASDDPYIQYSGYFNMLEYVASALYRAEPALYSTLTEGYGRGMRLETVAYWQFYEKYQDSLVGDISGSINDAYLQMQGTPGTQSYGMVVDLAVAYYKNQAPAS